MLKKPKDKVQKEIADLIDSFYINRPNSTTSLGMFLSDLEWEVKEHMHKVFRALIDNICDEKELSDKADDVLLENKEEV